MPTTQVRVKIATAEFPTFLVDEPTYLVQIRFWWFPFARMTYDNVSDLRLALITANRVLKQLCPNADMADLIKVV